MLVESPALQDVRQAGTDKGPAVDDRSTSITRAPEMLEQLLVDQLQDLLSAEGQLLKGLTTMIEASHSAEVRVREAPV